jgi:hypothetical protein
VKLPEPFTYFVDRSLGNKVLVQHLRDSRLRVEAHDDHFKPDTPDQDWLRKVGAQGWVVLTKDKAIRRNLLEREALIDARVACFMLGRGDLSAVQMSLAFVKALPRMTRALRRFCVPLAAGVSASGGVSVLLADGELLEKPILLK